MLINNRIPACERESDRLTRGLSIATVQACVALVLLGTACASAAPSPSVESCDADALASDGLAVATAALRGGATHETFLALEREQQDAIVALVVDGRVECSGALISPEHVLTARHCVPEATEGLAPLEARLGPDADQASLRIRVSEVRLHPSLDLALLTLSHSIVPDEDAIAPLALSRASFDAALLGRHVAVAGYGLDDALLSGERAFAIATVDSLDHDLVQVRGLGSSGLCFGDSGGPLLARGPQGQVEVLGVLSNGSTACDGEDRFTRIDQASAWLEQQLQRQSDTAANQSVSCAALGRAGRCFGNAAMRCAASELLVEPCADRQVCGWSEALDRYTCVEPSADSCSGDAEIGRCEGARAINCAAGTREVTECAPCGQRCEVSGRNGHALCVDG